VFLWGAQLNEGTIKPYQKTETRLNIPRLDYSNGTCPSLLVEPQRTNISQYVEAGSGGWSTGTISSASNILGLKAFNVLNNYALFGDAAYILSNTTFAANTTYTLSFYTDFSQCTGTEVGISFLGFAPSLAYTGININKTTKAITTFNIGGVFTLNSYEAVQIDGEIYKIVATATPNANVTSARNYIGTSSDATAAVFAGIQLEAGSYPTSYIQKTTSASVTRNADVISKTGISSLIGQTEGTLFVDLEDYIELDIPCLTIDNGTNDNRIVLYREFGTGYLGLFLAASGTTVSALSTTSASNGKIAIAYTGTTFVMYRNGVQILTTTSAIPSSMSAVRFNGRATNDFYTTRKIKSFALWKTRLDNSTLASLTTL
jgi:hypothetical protein